MNAVGIKGLTGEFLLTPHHEQTKPILSHNSNSALVPAFQLLPAGDYQTYNDLRSSGRLPNFIMIYRLATESKQIQRFSRVLKQGVDRLLNDRSTRPG